MAIRDRLPTRHSFLVDTSGCESFSSENLPQDSYVLEFSSGAILAQSVAVLWRRLVIKVLTRKTQADHLTSRAKKVWGKSLPPHCFSRVGCCVHKPENDASAVTLTSHSYRIVPNQRLSFAGNAPELEIIRHSPALSVVVAELMALAKVGDLHNRAELGDVWARQRRA